MHRACKQLSHFVPAVFCLILAACGGGGGGGGGGGTSSDQFTVSTASLNFTADVEAATPASQLITGTVTGVNSTIRVDVVIKGTAIASATFNLTGANSGSLTVVPKAPADLGVGPHADTIKVYVCTDLANCVGSPTQLSGSPKVINVAYSVTATPQVRYVSPWIAQTGATDDVILRGVGFSLLKTPSVDFGGNVATTVTVVSDTEIRATHPALGTGVYSVNVKDASGPILTNANLHVMTEPVLGYAFISATGEKTRILYDALRDSIYVANKGNGQIVRYVHSTDPNTGNPIWTPTTLTVTGLTDIAFAPDGTTLVATSNSSVQQVNLDTFTITSGTSIFSTDFYFAQIAIANDGVGFLAPHLINTVGSTWFYKYNLRKNTIDPVYQAVVLPYVSASSDGSELLLAEGEMLSTNPIYKYDTSGQVSTLSISSAASGLLMDRTGNTLWVGFGFPVYRGTTVLGAVYSNGPGSSAALASDGNTIYAYDPATTQLKIYNLNSGNGAGSFNQTAASPVSLASVGSAVAPYMALTPFGKTIFIAGSDGIIVQPLP